jgi:hypothetical protein
LLKTESLSLQTQLADEIREITESSTGLQSLIEAYAISPL